MTVPALVLTAGLATRLRPLSLIRAKAALPVAGVPLAARVIRWLTAAGITDIVLNLHHLPHTITRVIGDGRDLGARVRYSWEDPVLGSAGGPRHALPILDAPAFLIANGDTLTNLDPSAILAEHRRTGARVTMAVIPNPRPDRYGGVLLDGDIVRGFTPRNSQVPTFHFIGVQVVDASVFETLPDNVPSETVSQLYPPLIREDPGAVRAFASNASFEDIGTPGDYFDTSLGVATREHYDGIQRGARTHLHDTARLTRTILWDDVTVASGVTLTDCIVVDGVHIPARTKLDRCIVLPPDVELTGLDGQHRDNLLVVPF